jgi:hypothetical protein
MKKIFYLFFLVSTISFSQNVRFEGTIIDNNRAPLEMANVMAMNQGTKAMDAYAITNEKGKFILNLNANATYTIKLSYLGMQNKEITVTTQTQNITQNITMESGGIDLEGVEIVREMPVSIKGDTIVYNSDSFTNGTERKLEDVLKKLPGVEVDADGQVKVEGKSVTKLMVEGKDFFDGDTKLGVKNIPADAIDKVQVLRNYNENSILKGVENNQDNLAMNIKLKEGKKNFWFGDITAGIGVGHEDTRYNIAPKAFYYSPKYSINIMGNSNNVGEQAFTIQDYFRFSGGFRNIMGKGGGSINVGSNSLGINFFQDDRVKEIESHFGATNFSYNPSKSWSLSGFVIATSTLVDTDTQSTVNFLRPNTEEVASAEIRQDLGNQKNNLGLFKLSSTYKPSAKFQLDYDILTRLSAQRENNNLNRQVFNYFDNTNSSENILTAKKQDPININQNLSFYYTPTDKHIFAFESQYLYQNEDPLYNANLQSRPFVFDGYNQSQTRNDITQSRFIKTNKLDSRLDYYYVLTPKVNLNFTLANSYVYQSLNSSVFQRLDDGTINNLTASENTNDVGYRFNDSSLGFHLKWLTGKFTFTPGVTLHRFNLTNSQLAINTKQELTRFLPDFQMIYQIKKSESLTYNYALTNNFTNVNNFALGAIFNSYNSLFSGNRNLENSVVQSHTLNYQKFNMFNFENFGGFINYTRTTEAVKTRALFQGVNQIGSPFNSPFGDENLSGNFRYGRSFLKYYKANFSANVNWSKFYNIQLNSQNPQNVQEEVVDTESFTQNYRIGASTNFKDIPNIELSYSYTVNQYPNDTFYTDSPSVKLDYFFLKSFSFVSEYEFFHYYNNDKTVDQEYDFLSASLTYQKTKASHMEYKIAATNILNTTSINDDSFSQFSTRNSQYTVQPRYIIFSLKYNL